ncbi:MAG: hypothetical protein ACE5FG_13065 [Myxococcota bacterium]
MRGVWLPLLLAGCWWLGSTPEPAGLPDAAERVAADTTPAPAPAPAAPDDGFVHEALFERVMGFYDRLEGAPLDAWVTFTDSELRGYFVGARAFSDYYARLANRVREAGLRQARPTRVRVRGIRVEDEDLAYVDVLLVGPHQRRLLFWDLEIELTDVWRREGGVWHVFPDKL